jgi:hypothetical protein
MRLSSIRRIHYKHLLTSKNSSPQSPFAIYSLLYLSNPGNNISAQKESNSSPGTTSLKLIMSDHFWSSLHPIVMSFSSASTVLTSLSSFPPFSSSLTSARILSCHSFAISISFGSRMGVLKAHKALSVECVTYPISYWCRQRGLKVYHAPLMRLCSGAHPIS